MFNCKPKIQSIMKTTTYLKAFAILIAVTILTAGITTAAKPEKKYDAQDIRTVLTNSLQSKYFLKDDLKGVVDFTFTITDEGTINYKQFLSSNPAIEKFVKSNLSSLDLTPYAGILKQTYNIRFTFVQL